MNRYSTENSCDTFSEENILNLIIKIIQNPDYAGHLRGPEGRRGRDGKEGKDGTDGKDGKKGEPGPRGEPGPSGGPKGEKGEKGDEGPEGPQGKQGVKGDQGVEGKMGPRGERGEQGIQGQRGERGPPGAIENDFTSYVLKLKTEPEEDLQFLNRENGSFVIKYTSVNKYFNSIRIVQIKVAMFHNILLLQIVSPELVPEQVFITNYGKLDSDIKTWKFDSGLFDPLSINFETDEIGNYIYPGCIFEIYIKWSNN